MMVKHHRVSIFFKVVIVVSFFASSEHAPPEDKSRLLLLLRVVDKRIIASSSSSSVFHANRETERKNDVNTCRRHFYDSDVRVSFKESLALCVIVFSLQLFSPSLFFMFRVLNI